MTSRTPFAGTATNVGLSAANLNSNPGGSAQKVKVTSNQTGITSAVDLTGFTLTFTPTASRDFKISYRLMVQSTASGSNEGFFVSLYKDGTAVGAQGNFPMADIASGTNVLCTDFWVEESPTNASHTYKLVGGHFASGGTMQVSNAASTGILLIEDLGPTY